MRKYEIILTQGKKARVDRDVFLKLKGIKFYAYMSRGNWYARRETWLDWKKPKLSWIVMGRPPLNKNEHCVHINGDSLDCRRNNLEWVVLNKGIGEPNIQKVEYILYWVRWQENGVNHNRKFHSLEAAKAFRDNHYKTINQPKQPI